MARPWHGMGLTRPPRGRRRPRCEMISSAGSVRQTRGADGNCGTGTGLGLGPEVMGMGIVPDNKRDEIRASAALGLYVLQPTRYYYLRVSMSSSTRSLPVPYRTVAAGLPYGDPCLVVCLDFFTPGPSRQTDESIFLRPVHGACHCCSPARPLAVVAEWGTGGGGTGGGERCEDLCVLCPHTRTY